MSSGQTDHAAATVARNIRSAREARGLKQRELARLLNEESDAMLVSRWERGANRPSFENLVRLSEVLGHDLAWFHTDHEREVAA
jgi:transcriptional regulator with XRE-family HTH domain